MAFATVYDRTANYDISFYVASVAFGFGALILLLLGPYPQRGQAAAVPFDATAAQPAVR